MVVPITRGGRFARTVGFAVPLTGAGTKTTGVVRCDQPRALDLAAHSGRRLETVPEAIVDEVLARLMAAVLVALGGLTFLLFCVRSRTADVGRRVRVPVQILLVNYPLRLQGGCCDICEEWS